MTTLFASSALLPDGWARDVRVTLDGGRIAGVEPAATPGPDDLRLTGCALLPAMPNLHSHAFQRAMAGMTERRGEGDDSFWTWRTLMYRFLDVLTPEDIEAIAALLYTRYLLPFELAGFILLVAMIGAIVLTHRSRGDARGQNASRQIGRRPQDAVRNVNQPVGEGIEL